MPATMPGTAVVDGLRRWARGAYAEEAAVELLVRAFDSRFASNQYPWVRPCDRPGWYWLDGERLIDGTGALSGGQRRVLAVAASLVSGAALTDLGGLLTGLDRPNLELVLAALAHAAGSHEQVDAHVEGDLLVYRRLGPVLAWPTQVGAAMTAVEVLQFAVAVQLAAGVVTLVNVALSRLRSRS